MFKIKKIFIGLLMILTGCSCEISKVKPLKTGECLYSRISGKRFKVLYQESSLVYVIEDNDNKLYTFINSKNIDNPDNDVLRINCVTFDKNLK